MQEQPSAWPPFMRGGRRPRRIDRKSTRLNSSHGSISYAVFCLKQTTCTDDRVRETGKHPDLVTGDSSRLALGVRGELVRWLNHLDEKGTLGEPQPLLTETPKLLGPDRRKMSKSYDNCLYLADSPKEIEKKIMSAITDPARLRR